MTTGTRVLGGTKGGKDIVPFRLFDLRNLELNKVTGEAKLMYMPGVDLNNCEDVLLDTPTNPRYQLSVLKEYLITKNNRVCVLYGLRRTGKTTLIRQAIKWLIEERGIQPSEIFYVTVKDPRQALLDDIVDSFREGTYKYAFLDEVSFCSDFISTCAQLYDAFTSKTGQKIVIAGTNLVSIFVAKLHRLYDRTYRIPVHHLTFYEHCRFNGIINPGLEEFNDYLKHGGLFERDLDAFEYVRSAIITHLESTILNSDVQSLYAWFSNSGFKDYSGLVHNILLYSVGINVNSQTVRAAYSFKRESSLINLDDEVRSAMQKRLDLLKYTSVFMKETELHAFVKFLEDCGLLLTLKNIAQDAMPGDIAKTYITFPFIRFAYTVELAKMGGVPEPELRNEYLGSLMEVCAISEYHLAFPQDLIYFWRERIKGVPTECDLIITNCIDPGRGPHRAAFEIKASKKSNKGQRGFEKFAILHPEYEILPENCKVIGGEDVVDWVYELGRLAYISAGLEDPTLKRIVIPEKKVGAQRTSAFGDLNGWNMGN